MLIYKGVAKNNQVIEPSKYFALKGERIIKYRIGKRYYYKHLDKNNNLIADLGDNKLTGANLIQNNLKHISFKKLFLDLELKSKKKSIYYYKKKFREEIQYLKSIYPQPPIIIGGCGRSGTTLLLSILSSHRKIHGIKNETYCFTPNFLRIRTFYNHIKLKKEGKKCWIEKTPKNILCFDKIYKLFNEKVKLIHIVRNPLDVIHSKHPNSTKKFYVPLSRWKKDVGFAKKFEKISLTVKFEELLNNFDVEIKKILNYLNLPYDARLLKYYKFTSVKTNIAWGKNKIKNINKIQKKRKYNKNLLKTLKNDKTAIKLMKYYGYV